jgi:hypothetical protein
MMDSYRWLRTVSIGVWGNELVVFQPLDGNTYLFENHAKDVVVFCLDKIHFLAADICSFLSDQFDDIDENISFVNCLLDRLIQNDLVAKTLM